MKILSGSSNRPLAEAIAAHLDIPLLLATTHRFADHEISVDIQENIQGGDIFVIQPTSCPANDHLMELLVMADALKRGAAQRITAVIPYYGYGRQDRKPTPCSSLAARLVADLLTAAGVHRILTVDWHSAQLEGFFNIPAANLGLAPLFCDHIQKHYNLETVTVVSPDAGGLVRTRVVAERLKASMAIIDKRRHGPAGAAPHMDLIGDVKGRTCIIIDDLTDSAGTLCQAATVLKEAGAASVDAYISHGVLSGNALEKIKQSFLRHLVISDTIHPTPAISGAPKIKILSVASLIGETIYGMHQECYK